MDNIGQYGREYQLKVIAAVLSDFKFASRIYDILYPEYFESDALKWIASFTLEYFKEEHTLPTVAVYGHKVKELDGDQLLQEEVQMSLLTIYSYRDNSPDIPYISKTILKFCRDQKLKAAVSDSVPMIAEGNYDGIRKIVMDALRAGEDTDIGLDYLNDIDERYESLKRQPISTGWECIDEIMQGGLSYGEIGVIVGPSGSGKSWALASMAYSALLAGKKVLYVSLELHRGYVGVRFDSMATGMEQDKLKFNKDSVRKRMGDIYDSNGGELFIKWYPTKALSVVGLRSAIERMIMFKKRPDIIFLDYADLMKLEHHIRKRKDELIQELYEELRGLSGEYMLPIWTASQTNREGMAESREFGMINADKLSESMGKHFTADFMMSISRNDKDARSNIARFYVIKNRFGDDKIMFGSTFNTSIGDVRLFKMSKKEQSEISNGVNDNVGAQPSMIRERIRDVYNFPEP